MKLTKKTLLNLGFTESWPDGNPIEPWWDNKELDITFFKTPTVNEFFRELHKIYNAEGRRQVQDAIKQALAM